MTVLFCYIAGKVKFANVPEFEVKKDMLKQMFSLSLVFVSMIVFNNLCLKYVEVSFYQVARSLTTIFNVIFDYVILSQVTSLPAFGSCLLIISGFLLGNNQEVRWSLIGVVFGVSSSFFVAMYSIMLKKKLPLVEQNQWKITLYNNLNASFLFLPLIVGSGEVQTLIESPDVRTLTFWFLLTCSGLLGVCMSFVIASQVKYTSPLTHNVSATAKSAAQTLIALAIYRNPITKLGLLSVFVVIIGSTCYGLVRKSEMKRAAAAEAAAKEMTTINGEEDTTKETLLEQESGKQ